MYPKFYLPLVYLFQKVERALPRSFTAPNFLPPQPVPNSNNGPRPLTLKAGTENTASSAQALRTKGHAVISQLTVCTF